MSKSIKLNETHIPMNDVFVAAFTNDTLRIKLCNAIALELETYATVCCDYNVQRAPSITQQQKNMMNNRFLSLSFSFTVENRSNSAPAEE